VDNICPNNKVELSISVDNIDQDLNEKIELVKKLATDYETIIADLYDFVYNPISQSSINLVIYYGKSSPALSTAAE